MIRDIPAEDVLSTARLVVACFLAGVSLDAWLKMPPGARKDFAAAHGLAPTDLVAANRLIGEHVVAESGLLKAHRTAVLDALFDRPTALPSQPLLEFP